MFMLAFYTPVSMTDSLQLHSDWFASRQLLSSELADEQPLARSKRTFPKFDLGHC